MAPTSIDIQKDLGVTLGWPDGTTAFYSVARLRRLSPSADARTLRAEVSRNPLAVVPSSGNTTITILDAALRGNYALWIRFSDGHETGIYSWEYLKEIGGDPA